MIDDQQIPKKTAIVEWEREFRNILLGDGYYSKWQLIRVPCASPSGKELMLQSRLQFRWALDLSMLTIVQTSHLHEIENHMKRSNLLHPISNHISDCLSCAKLSGTTELYRWVCMVVRIFFHMFNVWATIWYSSERVSNCSSKHGRIRCNW